MEHFYHNLGEKWFNYQALYSQMVMDFPDKSHFVEVGSWKGMSSAFMAVEIINSGKDIRFDCVDLWDYDVSQNDISEDMYKNLYDIFIKNIEPVKHIINPIKDFSLKASKLYNENSIDFIFIDGAHDYKNVKTDIESWFPKLKLGGIIAGHDYDYDGVSSAVNGFFKDKEIFSISNCWIYKK